MRNRGKTRYNGISKTKQYKDNLRYSISMCHYDSVEEQQYLQERENYYNFDCYQYELISDEVIEYNTYFSEEEKNDFIPYGFLVDELREILPDFIDVVHLPIECYM